MDLYSYTQRKYTIPLSIYNRIIVVSILFSIILILPQYNPLYQERMGSLESRESNFTIRTGTELTWARSGPNRNMCVNLLGDDL